MQQESSQTQNTSDNLKSSETNDCIILSGFNRITKWKFPFIKHCPVKRCGLSFKSRLAAIDHYKATHAMHFIHCNLCNTPIHVGKTSLKNFKDHHQHVHPNQSMQSLSKMDTGFRKSHTECSTCEINFTQVDDLNQHLNKVHSSKIIPCPLFECEYTSNREHFIRNHWAEKHSIYRFPSKAFIIASNGQPDYYTGEQVSLNSKSEFTMAIDMK